MRFGLMAAAAACVVSSSASAALITGSVNNAGTFFYSGNDFPSGFEARVSAGQIVGGVVTFDFVAGLYTNTDRTEVDSSVMGTLTCNLANFASNCLQRLSGTFPGTENIYQAELNTFSVGSIVRFQPNFVFRGQNRSDYGFVVTNVAISANVYAPQQGSYSIATLTSGVPEPATWALMILGFGAIGVALRRKNMPHLSYVGK